MSHISVLLPLMATSWLHKDAMEYRLPGRKSQLRPAGYVVPHRPRTGGPLSLANAWSPIARERVVPHAASAWYIIAREMTTGIAIGLDMTPEMLARARANQKILGLTNVEFREGRMGNIPLPDASVDMVISNGVLNLSTEKRQTFRELYRVLKPGGWSSPIRSSTGNCRVPPEVESRRRLYFLGLM